MHQSDSEMTEHILGILSSMLRSLPAESAPRIRLLAKFVEKDYEKLNRLVQIRRDYASKLAAVDREIKSERAKLPQTEQDDMADEWLSRRMDAGLYSLQVSATAQKGTCTSAFQPSILRQDRAASFSHIPPKLPRYPHLLTTPLRPSTQSSPGS